ncbi:hypothetical protein IAQ67_20425 [Paenibacillus peoriae]|uniref:Uncharacterized protein n=1 Tax=Paenibacillus peoriae TaxID=59893 RepID=A0A7H0Y539_9BACL|nr:hypothetical protein [Paenibacillus peoriae]QNR66197.1 hypothetical protein IAQ67_20425 [Paenibacillus peoriae]
MSISYWWRRCGEVEGRNVQGAGRRGACCGVVRAVAKDNTGYTFEPLLRGATERRALSRMPRSVQNARQAPYRNWITAFASEV